MVLVFVVLIPPFRTSTDDDGDDGGTGRDGTASRTNPVDRLIQIIIINKTNTQPPLPQKPQVKDLGRTSLTILGGERGRYSSEIPHDEVTYR